MQKKLKSKKIKETKRVGQPKGQKYRRDFPEGTEKGLF